MIEINLIPAKLKKAKQMQIYIMAGIGVAVIIAGVMLGVVWKQMNEIAKLNRAIKKIDAESAALKDRIQEVRRFKAKEEIYEKKKKILDKLLEKQSTWPKIMDFLIEATPDDMWYEEIMHERTTQEGIRLSVKGKVFSKLILSEYIRRLEQSDRIKEIQMVEIKDVSENEGVWTNFTVTFLYTIQEGEK
ncbi:MAG: PilN domain-containing protein [Candidatus Goldiibacteriota bacterium]